MDNQSTFLRSSTATGLLLRGLIPALVLMFVAPGLAGARESKSAIDVTHTISVRSDNWLPLPADEMKRAAGDAALARLTDAGRLALAQGSKRAGMGALDLEIGLIGPAETAKLTIRLDSPGAPTLVSTASISVRGLDHAGIYGALEHVGKRAADRLVTKLDLWQQTEVADAQRTGRSILDDPALKRLFDDAQSAKRSDRFAEAHAGFENVVASASDSQDPLRLLAEDELRYGLPLYEARQALNQLGRFHRADQQAARTAALTRAENLFRQIQAENPTDLGRIQESQRALDDLLIARRALGNAMRAALMSRLQGARIALWEYSMSEGECPNRERARSLIEGMGARVELFGMSEEPGGGRRYHLKDPHGAGTIDLLCSDQGVEVAESLHAGNTSPASAR